jgi:GPI mannosyltransferase 3
MSKAKTVADKLVEKKRQDTGADKEPGKDTKQHF